MNQRVVLFANLTDLFNNASKLLHANVVTSEGLDLIST